MRRKHGKIVTATVAKWFLDQGADFAVGTKETLYVESIHWNNKTANAGGTLQFENESGGEDFWRVSLDVAGSSGSISFIRFDGDPGLPLTLAKDILVTLSGGATNCWVTIQCGSVGK